MNHLKSSRNLLILSLFVMVMAAACSGQSTTEPENVTSSSSVPESASGEGTSTLPETDSAEPSEMPSDPDISSESADPESSSDLATPTTPVTDSAEPSETPLDPDISSESAVPESSSEEATPNPPAPEAAELIESPSDPEISSESFFDWNLIQVGEGIKPAIGVDKSGIVHIAFIAEADHGGVFYGSNASGDFEIETVSEGYFYGPLDLALGPDGAPYIAYHDHQDTTVNPELGDEVVAILKDGSWDLVTVEHAGHDGWDNSIAVDSSGNWHTAAVDPSQFNSESGIEYATDTGGSIIVSE